MHRWFAAFFLALPLAAAAQDTATPGASQEKASFENVTFPFEGEVTADRLNVRMFPKTDNTSLIAAILAQGEKITVVGEKEGFYQILPPKGCMVWVFARNIKRDGDAGTVLSDAVPVRIDSRINATQVTSLNTGDTVKVVAEHMGWLKIEAPHSVPYFVGTKYVRMVKALDKEQAGIVTTDETRKTAPAAAPGDDAEAMAKIREAESLLQFQSDLLRQKRIKDLDYRGVVRSYEEALVLAKTDAVRAQAEGGVKMYGELQKQLDALQARILTMEEYLKKEQEIRAERETPRKATYAFTGYIETVGMLWNRPAPYKLTMGGKTICFVKPRDGDEPMVKNLNWHYKEYVGISGMVVKDPPGWEGYSVVVVEEVVPLTKE